MYELQYHKETNNQSAKWAPVPVHIQIKYKRIFWKIRQKKRGNTQA